MGWLSGLTTIASLGLNLIGAKVASDASENAAKTQVKAGEKAIGIDQQGQRDALAAVNKGYGAAEQLYAPYMQIGASAVPSLTRLAGSNYPGAQPSPYLPPQGAPQGTGSPPPSVASLTMGQPPQEALVPMRAPNGQTSQVPASQVAHFKQKGAVVLQ